MSELRAISLIVFDLDGTLINSRPDIALSANEMLAELGLSSLSEQTVNGFIGDGARWLVQCCLETCGYDTTKPDEIDRALEIFVDRYHTNAWNRSVRYQGADELLCDPPVPIALATNKPEGLTRKIFEHLGWLPYFQTILGGDSLAERKPHRMVLDTISQRTGVDATELLMVGDGPQDIAAGQAVGAATCGVTWGYHSDKLHGDHTPDYRIESLAELPALAIAWR